MIAGKRFVAVVPARGGSVSVPRKNIRPLGGVPLIVHTLNQSRSVPELDLTAVSTDDYEIASIARDHGSHVIMRPPHLATDDAPTEGALLHALDALENERPFDFIVVLEPTSPFRTAPTILGCLEAIATSDAPSLVTVCETRASLGRIIDGRFRRLEPSAPRRRQDRQPVYFECGTVYVCRTEHLRQTGSLVAEDWLAFPVAEEESLDINSATDFAVAEAILSQKGRR